MRKVSRIVVALVLAIPVLFTTAAISSLVADLLVGTKIDSSGDEVLNGGGLTGTIIFLLSFVVSIVFAVCFYKYVRIGKKDKEKSEKSD